MLYVQHITTTLLSGSHDNNMAADTCRDIIYDLYNDLWSVPCAISAGAGMYHRSYSEVLTFKNRASYI